MQEPLISSSRPELLIQQLLLQEQLIQELAPSSQSTKDSATAKHFT